MTRAEKLVMPIANRIAELPYSDETKMKIASVTGFTIGFVGTGAVMLGSYVALTKLKTKLSNKN